MSRSTFEKVRVHAREDSELLRELIEVADRSEAERAQVAADLVVSVKKIEGIAAALVLSDERIEGVAEALVGADEKIGQVADALVVFDEKIGQVAEALVVSDEKISEVASDLRRSHRRADLVAEGTPGKAADAASQTGEKPTKEIRKRGPRK